MRFLIVACLVAAAVPTRARADDDRALGARGRPVDKGTFGVGLVLGEPTGVSVKLYLKDDQAIQGAVGFAFVNTGVQADADYVFHPWILQDKDSYVLPVYLGPGARLINYSKSGGGSYIAPGLRAVIGMLFDFKTVPLDAFLEVAGVLEYKFGETASQKGAGFAINLGAGLRYYF